MPVQLFLCNANMPSVAACRQIFFNWTRGCGEIPELKAILAAHKANPEVHHKRQVRATWRESILAWLQIYLGDSACMTCTSTPLSSWSASWCLNPVSPVRRLLCRLRHAYFGRQTGREAPYESSKRMLPCSHAALAGVLVQHALAMQMQH